MAVLLRAHVCAAGLAESCTDPGSQLQKILRVVGRRADMRQYRVVQWSTGEVGSIAVRVLAARPDLALAGVWVHSAEKAGRDAGELVGIGPLGIAASSDADALLATAPDCVCYTASGESRPEECVAD